MNIFGVGGAEIVVIIMIMLIVAGPKRMIRWMYVIGQYVGKFRDMWSQMVDVMQDEVDAAGLDVKLPRDIPTKQSLAKTAGQFMKPYIDPIEQTLDDVAKPIKDTINETNKTIKEATHEAETSTKIAMGEEKAETVPSEVSVEPPSAPDIGFGAWSTSSGQAVEQEA